MIAKQVKGSGFRGALEYNLKKGKVIDSNMAGENARDLSKEFRISRMLKPNLKKAVYHTSLAVSKDERKLTDNEFKEIANSYLEKMGFDDNQFIIFRHFDTEHPHIHIVASRIKLSGDIVSDSNDYKRSELIVRQIEKQYNLLQLKELNQNSKSLTKNEIENSLRTGKSIPKIVLQNKLDQILKRKVSPPEMIKELNLIGANVKFNISKTTKNISGVSFEYAGILFKGSSLGKKYSWNNIKDKIDYDKNRDSRIIVDNNNGIENNQPRVSGTNKNSSEFKLTGKISENNRSESKSDNEESTSISQNDIKMCQFQIIPFHLMQDELGDDEEYIPKKKKKRGKKL